MSNEKYLPNVFYAKVIDSASSMGECYCWATENKTGHTFYILSCSLSNEIKLLNRDIDRRQQRHHLNISLKRKRSLFSVKYDVYVNEWGGSKAGRLDSPGSSHYEKDFYSDIAKAYGHYYDDTFDKIIRGFGTIISIVVILFLLRACF